MPHRYRELRDRMVDEQICRRGITDPGVIEAMKEIPRHLFVPEVLEQRAYEDCSLPIGYGQTISQPYIVAYMTEVLKIGPTHKVLEIGTGSGYQTAILSRIAERIYSIEINLELQKRAAGVLAGTQARDTFLKWGDGNSGWEENSPYDRIIVTAAVEKEIPLALVRQLKEGGTMVLPQGGVDQHLVLCVKKRGALRIENLFAVQFVPMVQGALA